MPLENAAAAVMMMVMTMASQKMQMTTKMKVGITRPMTEAAVTVKRLCVCKVQLCCSVLHFLLLSGFCWIMLVERGALKKKT